MERLVAAAPARIGLDPGRAPGNALAMTRGLLSFVGRDEERATLLAAVEEARAGRGGLWLLSGEPGVGKSRLVEEVCRAAGPEITALWGRCWEAGGAPAYWPWIQLLRALSRARPEAARPLREPRRRAALAQLLPELRDGEGQIGVSVGVGAGGGDGAAGPPPAPLATPSLDGEPARFALLDAVCGALCDAASAAPLLLVLEDLHAADRSSLLLLDFVAQQARSARVALFGTFRDAEAERAAEGGLLLGLARGARRLPLAPLPREAVAAFLGEALARGPEAAVRPELVDAVYARTEGNALFLVELVPLLARAGDRGGAGALGVPGSVRTAIRGRLAELPGETRAALELGAVLGREFRTAAVADAFDRDPVELAAALGPAVEAALVAPIAPGQFRFAHILVREVLHGDVEPGRRAALHLAVAEALRTAHGGRAAAPWSEIAHHFRAAGPAGRRGAIDASVRAAEAASAQLAFDEAVAAYEAALADLAETPGADPTLEIELLLGKGRAQLARGAIDEGRRACRRAVDLARALGAPELRARATLEYGAPLLFGTVDPELVRLLEEALAGLGDEASPLRARVMARLAAAMQPARDPERPMALARAAIDMARRGGDERALLATLRAGCSALVDLADPIERLPLNREHVALAERLGERADALRGQVRLAFDGFELGDLGAARAAIAAVRRLGAELRHPAYRWPGIAFAATEAMWTGAFDVAARAIEEAGVAAGGADPNAHAARAWQAARLARLRGDGAGLDAAAALEEALGGGAWARACAAYVRALGLVGLGRREEGAAALPAEARALLLDLQDRTTWEGLAEIAWAAGDRDLAAHVHDRLAAAPERLVSGGVLSMCWEGCAARGLALCAWTLGRRAEALGWFEAAVARARATGGRPVAAWASAECAALLLEGAPSAAERARGQALAAEAASAARELGMSGLLARAEALGAGAAGGAAPAPTPTPTPAARPALPSSAAPRLRQEGELWTLTAGEVVLRLEDGKGVQYLARLLEAPGRELHVLDLAAEPGSGAGIDGGDAGPLLDAEARRSYRARLATLDEALEEAEARGDAAAAGRARAERELLAAELARAVGLGGRERRAGGAVERARVNVQRRLRDVLRRIAQLDPALGRALERSVRTGTYCRYEP